MDKPPGKGVKIHQHHPAAVHTKEAPGQTMAVKTLRRLQGFNRQPCLPLTQGEGRYIAGAGYGQSRKFATCRSSLDRKSVV